MDQKQVTSQRVMMEQKHAAHESIKLHKLSVNVTIAIDALEPTKSLLKGL
jgi:hypothetical protein